MDLFENAVFMFSCGRVKTQLFENADVTISIYDVPEDVHGSSGIMQGHFDCLCSFVKVRTEEFESSSDFVWTGIFSKTPLVWTQIFFIRIKKTRFQKYPDTCGRGLNSDFTRDLLKKIPWRNIKKRTKITNNSHPTAMTAARFSTRYPLGKVNKSTP